MQDSFRSTQRVRKNKLVLVCIQSENYEVCVFP